MPETKKIDPALLDHLRAIVGPAGYIDDPADMEAYVAEWRGRWKKLANDQPESLATG